MSYGTFYPVRLVAVLALLTATHSFPRKKGRAEGHVNAVSFGV